MSHDLDDFWGPMINYPIYLQFHCFLTCKMLTLELLSRHQIINHCFFHLWFGKPQKHWLTQKDLVTLPSGKLT
jgi:hypothetical protein